MIYYDAPPYPFIKLIATEIIDDCWLKGNDERLIKKAKDWILTNKDEIIRRLKNIKNYVQINDKLWRENDKYLEVQENKTKDTVLCEMIRFQTDRGLDKKTLILTMNC